MNESNLTNFAIAVQALSKSFRIFENKTDSLKQLVTLRRKGAVRTFDALRDVNLDVLAGTALGIIGGNGSGKSTLLKCLCGILEPDSGRITINGRIIALLELGAGFHPDLTGRENIYLNSAVLGLTKKQVDQHFDAIVDFAELSSFIDMPIKNYSSGMVVRLGFAIAIHSEPDILIIDEVLSVGDEAFQSRSLEKIRDLQRSGVTIVVVSHALGTLADLCTSVLWMEKGRVRKVGPSDEVIPEYIEHMHPELKETLTVDSRSNAESKPVSLTQFAISSIETKTKDVYQAGEGIIFTAEVSSNNFVGIYTISIHVFTLSGHLVWKTETSSRPIAIGDDGVAQALYQCRINRFPLNLGIYQVSVVLRDAQNVELDYVPNAARINIVSSKTEQAGNLFVDDYLWHLL